MDIDLHTLRMAGGQAAADWAMEQENWVIVGIEHERDHEVLVRALQKLGRTIHLVCPRCSQEYVYPFEETVHSSIEHIDAQVDVISLHGDIDHWALTPHISQRMQWYGDIKVIWPSTELSDERWVSEMYDYGIAVASNCSIDSNFESMFKAEQ